MSHEKAVTNNQYQRLGELCFKKKKLIIVHSDDLHDKITAVPSMLMGFLQWEEKGLVTPRSLGMHTVWTESRM